MRLLIYIHSLENGGAERVAVNLANHWGAAGWQVTVVTVAAPDTDFYTLAPAVTRVALGLSGTRRNLAAGLWRTVRRVRALRRILRALRPDVALSAMHTANVVLALAGSGLALPRLIGSEHNFPPKAPMGIIWETLRRHAYGRLGAVVALTGEGAAWLDRHTLARRVQVIPNPVCWPLADQQPYVSTAPFRRAGRHLLLGVGRLAYEKNFAGLIAAFARLAGRHPTWDLVILGEGPLRAALQAQAREAGLLARIFLPGRVGNMADWYAGAALYAMTSHFEGFPNTLVEAMAHGVPVVSVDCDTGPRDIIRDGIDGVLVPSGDDDAIDTALHGLMGDALRRTSLARRASEVRQRFAIDRIAGCWEALFRDL